MSITYGLRVVGDKSARRRSVDWRSAFVAYCAGDQRAQVDREGYLSHFTFDQSLDEHMKKNGGSEAGYDGLCGADWLHWDIDRAGDFGRATSDARRLAGAVLDRYRELGDDDLLIFLSGGKGFHVGIPTALWRPSPSACFNQVARRFCEAHAERAGVPVDASVYSKVRLFRAPNSRHPATGLHKRRLMLDELMNLGADFLVEMAKDVFPFGVPVITAMDPVAIADWAAAASAVEQRTAERRATYQGVPSKLAAASLAFIRTGEAEEGDRHRTIFAVAANLGEAGCPDGLAHDLLTEHGLDLGLAPSDVRRQIDCGLTRGRRHAEGEEAQTSEPKGGQSGPVF